MTYCAYCLEPIDDEEPRYEFPDGAVVHEDCGLDYIDSKYLCYGEVDQG